MEFFARMHCLYNVGLSSSNTWFMYISEFILLSFSKKCIGSFTLKAIAPHMPIVILPFLNVGFKYRDSIAVPLRRIIWHEHMSKPVSNVALSAYITCNQFQRVYLLCSLAHFNLAPLHLSDENSFLHALKQK